MSEIYIYPKRIANINKIKYHLRQTKYEKNNTLRTGI